MRLTIAAVSARVVLLHGLNVPRLSLPAIMPAFTT